MSCNYAVPIYIPHSKAGIDLAISNKNGHGIQIKWTRAYPSSYQYNIAYNIYYSSLKEDVYEEGVKYVSIDPNILSVEISDFPPGDTFYFAVRATQFLKTWVDLFTLPNYVEDESKYYPETLLQESITDADLTLKLSDVSNFPSYGIIQIGTELIQYLHKDLASNTLLNCIRGFFNTSASSHEISIVKFWKGLEEQNTVCMQETAVFSYPEYPHTNEDGYKEVTKDWLTTNLSASDASQENFPRYDFKGWRRIDPGALLRGDCVGSYFGGQRYCADGYDGVGRVLRGISVTDASHQRLEMLLDTIGTGDLCALIKKMRTGKRCYCFQLHNESPDERCPQCLGGGFIISWVQFFNPRRSDGLIRVRFSPADDQLKLDETGYDPNVTTEAWTLVYPIIKDRDVLVRLSEDGQEEFRYEVLSVNRNKLLDGLSGAQHLRVQRIRKTDPIYTVRVNYDTSIIPSTTQTGISFVPGPGGIPPHTHTIHLGPNNLAQGLQSLNQTTETSQGHNHLIIDGIVQEALNHTHTIILP